MPPITSAKEAIDALGQGSSEKTVAGAISYLLALLSTPEGANQFNEERSKQLLGAIAQVFQWFDVKDSASQPQKEELARCLQLLALIPKAFPHLPSTFSKGSFFQSNFEKYTSPAERSSVKFALVGLYAKIRSAHPPTKGGKDQDQPPVWAWLKKQLKENKIDSKLGLASRLVNACEDLLAMGDNPAVQNAECAMDCLAAMRFLGEDLYAYPAAAPGSLLSDFAFFPFASKVTSVVVVDQQAEPQSKMMEHFSALYMVWRRLRVLDAKQREQEEAFAQRLSPKFATTSPDELRFLTNWCHNSRHSARVLLAQHCHVLALEVVAKSDSAPPPAMVEASLALLVNLARKQAGASHQLLVDAGVGPALCKALESPNPVVVHQALAVALNMASSSAGRAAFTDLPSRIVFHILPAYVASGDTAEGKLVLEMALGVLWGLVVRLPAHEQANGTFLDQWLGQVFNAVVTHCKEEGIVRRGLGALIAMFSLNKDSQKLTARLLVIFPAFLLEFRAVNNNPGDARLVSDIDLFTQLVSGSS